jgi:hypothetical protein
MQALVRIQAYMLADVVVAIPAVDLAIEEDHWTQGWYALQLASYAMVLEYPGTYVWYQVVTCHVPIAS